MIWRVWFYIVHLYINFMMSLSLFLTVLTQHLFRMSTVLRRIKMIDQAGSNQLAPFTLKHAAQTLLLPLALCLSLPACASEANIVLPPPVVNETVKGNHEVIVFSGGCFWGVQGVFQYVKALQKPLLAMWAAVQQRLVMMQW